MPIRWKVTTLDRRSCLVFAKGYKYHYKKGSVVTARKETIGIMTFTTEKEAESFAAGFIAVINNRSCKILKVEGIGRGKRPKAKDLCHFTDVISFYIRILNVEPGYIIGRDPNKDVSPKGTMCYKSVKVLT